ncbi:MAG: metallophosphoesterase [Gammaproteobacteria bacterium]|nr:metallophosphoesterase [Gammaproteobacteria bacterium]
MTDNKHDRDHVVGDVDITRRTFLHKSLLTGGAVATGSAVGVFQTLSSMEIASAAMSEPFSFAWVSDTHLYPRELNQRFIDKTVRAFSEVQAMGDKFDFMVFGGDLAQLGHPVEIELGAELLQEVTIPKHFIPGEHDWYLDLGESWNKHFGETPWTFDHKGVRIIGVDSVGRAPDYWSARGMSNEERMAHMSGLDGSQAGPWSGLGREQRQWLSSTLSDWPKDAPVIIFSHTPFYEYYPPWNFWIRDWRQVQEILAPWQNVTNIHGHVHQPLYNEIGGMRSIGMLATSWPWPYAPEGVPALTKPMLRVDPGDHFDGVGWGSLAMNAEAHMEVEYMMWREQVFGVGRADSGTGDNVNQKLSPRISDRGWTGD